MIKYFPVIPSKAGSQAVSSSDVWVLGLRSAASKMTVIAKYWGKKLEHRVKGLFLYSVF